MRVWNREKILSVLVSSYHSIKSRTIRLIPQADSVLDSAPTLQEGRDTVSRTNSQSENGAHSFA